MSIIKEGQIGTTTIGGKEVPVITVPIDTTIKNLLTNTEYDSEEAAQADIADPNTATTAEHVQRNVKVKCAKLVDLIGLSGKNGKWYPAIVQTTIILI